MDLSTFTDPDNKALAVLFLLYRLMSSAHSAFAENPGRIHLTVVEEAHRVLNDRQASQHPDVADTRAAMVEEFANALSEVRYAGEGLIILDQMPSRLSPAVLANTNMKLAHRLPTGEEQQCLSKAAGLTDGQQNLLYRLKPGEALWLSPDGSTYHIQVPFFDK
jgi:DNA helicase HerA-like ATPase